MPILTLSIHTGISDHELDDEESIKKVKRSEDKSLYKKVYPNDLVFNMMRAWQGAFGVSKIDGMVSPAYIVAEPIAEINANYLSYYIQTNRFIGLANSLSYGVTDFRKRLYWNGFCKITMHLPSLDEQNKIALLLMSVDRVIKKQKETVSAWEERKKGVMQKLFNQEVRFKADDGNEFSEWEEKKLGEVCAPLTYGMNAAAVKYDGENKYIRITDIDDESHLYKNDGLVSPDGELDDKYLVSENDILLARTGASVGKSYLYDKKDGKLYYAGFLIKAHVKSENSKFIYYQTLTDRYARWVQVTSMRSGQPGINANEYSEFMVYVPCLAEQQKIADSLSSLDEVIEKQKATLAAWEELKKGLLQQMFV